MNTYERFERAIHFKEPDFVPTYDLIMHPGIFDRYSGREGTILERNVRMCKAIGLDATRYIHDPDHHWLVGTLETWGRFFGIDANAWEAQQSGSTWWIAQRPFTDLEGLRLHMPRLARGSAIRAWYSAYLKEVRAVFYPHVVFMGETEGPVTNAFNFCGLQLFSEAILLAPDLVRHLLDVTTEWARLIAETYAEHPTAPAFLLADDIAWKGGTLFSPKWLREEVFPRFKYIMEPLREGGIKCFYHSDGNLNQVLDELVHEVGIEGLNPIEPGAGMDIVAIRRQYPHLVLLGNIDTSDVLPFGIPSEVEQAVRRLIQAVAPGGGLLLGSSSEIHAQVPIENALTMYWAARKYGRYPIA
ncbi:MAG: uroporphyrinogen decarboxylase family protein [Anaerolineae bacterium]